MKLNFITLMVRDIEKSVAFYQELAGLNVIRCFNPGAGTIVFLANGAGETMLELIQFDDAQKVSTKGLVICFLADGNLAQLREKALVLGYSPSELMLGGPAPDHFKLPDPDGVTIEFCV